MIEDNNITDESLVVDSSIEGNDSTPIAVIEGPVVIDEVDQTELTLTSTVSLDEVAVNPVSNLPLTEREPNIDAAKTVGTQQVNAGVRYCFFCHPIVPDLC